MKSPQKIVFDGPKRLRSGAEYEKVRRELLRDIAQRYRDPRTLASFWGRLWVDIKVRREVRAELKKQFPTGALFVVPVMK